MCKISVVYFKVIRLGVRMYAIVLWLVNKSKKGKTQIRDALYGYGNILPS